MFSLRPVNKTPAQPGDPRITDAEGAALARAVVNLFRLWQLSDREACVLLGELSPRTWARWKAGTAGRISRDQKTRLSLLVGIHKALRLTFREPERAYGWIRRPNEAFGGASALEVMQGGEISDLARVRFYLDAERGGW